LSYLCGMIGCVTAVRLREWRGVKPVAGPCGVAITTRLWTTPADERVLDLVAGHLGRLRRADLAAITGPQPLDPAIDETARRQARRDRLNTRKKALTAASSARWANALIAGNDAQHRLARDAQHRHLIGVRAAIATIEKRLAQPTADTLTAEERKGPHEGQIAEGLPHSGRKVSEAAPPAPAARRAGPGVRRSGRPPCACGGGRQTAGHDPPPPARREPGAVRVARGMGWRPGPHRGHGLRR
jgi:hypothetical protein